ncbi:MAG: hypothetical protein QOE82_1208 [Thermoanaerobaculia bacterium]|jgi:uncharacterized protein (TIGR04255 family)|nr:hypothetical protein [Thermoanaerobaculia bacterium]
MSSGSPVLARSPIIEAVVDIDCDLPADLEFADLEAQATERFSDHYPGFRRIFRPTRHPLVWQASPPQLDVRAATDAFQLFSDAQLVQVRRGGFSFNRFRPYENLDAYLPEIKRTWKIFMDLVSPVAVRRIGLRYINRIFLPPGEDIVDLSEYLNLGSKLPEDVSLSFTSVLNEYSAVEDLTGNDVKVRIVIDEQEKRPWLRENPPLPVILDIAGSHRGSLDPQVWENIESAIHALRRMDDAIFQSTLTERCLDLFR